MPTLEITSCRIVQRTTRYDRRVLRDKEYAFSEILIETADGRTFCSRTWDLLPNTAHERANQIAAFHRRMKAAGQTEKS